jgi:hypothetical protein
MCNYNNLNFGTYLFENKRVNCQNLENVKDLFNQLFNYKLNQDPKAWDKLKKIFDIRHKIIHKSITTKIEPSEINETLKHMYKIVSEIDRSLFSQYNFE